MKARGTPPVFASTPDALLISERKVPEVRTNAADMAAPQNPAMRAERNASLNEVINASR